MLAWHKHHRTQLTEALTLQNVSGRRKCLSSLSGGRQNGGTFDL